MKKRKYSTSGEVRVEGTAEDNDEWEEEGEDDEKVKEVRENARTSHAFHYKNDPRKVLLKIPHDESAKSWATIRSRRNCATIRTWYSLFCETWMTIHSCRNATTLRSIGPTRTPSTEKAYFVLCFSMLRWFIGILQGIPACIGTSNFVQAAFIVSLNSSSFGSIKNIPLNCLASSGFFGFSICPSLIASFLPHRT